MTNPPTDPNVEALIAKQEERIANLEETITDLAKALSAEPALQIDYDAEFLEEREPEQQEQQP